MRKFTKKLKTPKKIYKILIIWLFCVSLIPCTTALCQNSFFGTAPIPNYNRIVPLAVSDGILYTTSMVGLDFLWYKNYPHSAFHFFNDNNEWMQMDKCGHILTAYTIARLTAALYRWSGVRDASSTTIGVALGMAYQTNIEIFDGFSSAWGFSLGDMTANTLGASLFLSQQAAWNDQRVTMKISFHPTSYAQYRPDELGDNFAESSLKDYNGQTYWLSFAIASFFPKGTKIPGWLCLDFGYGADGMVGGSSNPIIYNSNGDEVFFDRYRQVYCSLDIDLTKIPTNSGALKAVLGAVSFIKIPAPTLEFSRGKFKFHILYF